MLRFICPHCKTNAEYPILFESDTTDIYSIVCIGCRLVFDSEPVTNET